MYVLMKKLTETTISVEYQFEMAKPGGKYIFENNTPRLIEGGTAYGYCFFNKKTQEFRVDEKKTDQYFLKLNKERPYYNGLCYEIFYVYGKILEISIHNLSYPETIRIATG